MSQGVNSETLPPVDPNLLENQHVVTASQGLTSSNLPSTAGSEASSWTMHRVDNSSTENGYISNSEYHYHQHMQPSVNSSSNLGTTNAAQGHNGYASYPNSTDQYGCGSTGYSDYYNNYQQQSSSSYSQPVGTYQNTGAPYQPISSFQNSGSYAGSTTNSSTYYNPGDYQTAGGYPSSSYNNQTTQWNDGTYANYSSHQYPHYTPDAASIYSSGTATTQNYQQHYKQWADYYSQTEVSCAPGTENLSVSSTSNYEGAVSSVNTGYSTLNSQQPSVSTGYPTSISQQPSVSTGYATLNSQQPPPYTPSWRLKSNSADLPPVESGTVISGFHDGYWKRGIPTYEMHHSRSSHPQFSKPLDQNPAYDSLHDQQISTCPQGPILQYPYSHQEPQPSQVTQALQNYQSPSQADPSLDTQRVSKLQIPTNPRIASNLTFGLPKADKERFSVNAAKPAYISVSLLKSDDKTPPNDGTDSMLKPGTGTFPKSLCSYVERALACCKNDIQMAACQAVMKEMMTKATGDGTLYTRNWDIEPLFQFPDASNNDLQNSNPVSSLPKFKKSPTRRPKSRWEPLPEEKPAEKPAFVSGGHVNCPGWVNLNERDKKALLKMQMVMGSNGSKDVHLNNIRFSSLEQKGESKIRQKPVKKQRLVNGLNAADYGDMSSDSDKEQNLTAYYSGAIALASSPEEKKRRESRSKRFEKGRGHQAEVNYLKPKIAGAGNLYTRRASAMVLNKKFEDGGGSRAVEDIDWDALTVKGTCQEIEKRYLRLTSAPDPSTVRPEEVLEKALLMVQNSDKNYLYKCDQLKSIRQDLTVQRIHNQLTVKVYETHARLALEVGDLPEYNQCQSRLKSLYSEGIGGCHVEFAAYSLLCVILHSNNNRDLLSLMARLSDEAKRGEAVKHALALRAAVTAGNYVLFFRLYKTAPNLSTCLMDLYVEKMRFKAVTCMSRSYRPTVPVSYIAQVLGFTTMMHANEGSEDKDSDGIEECVDWLKAHGACLITDNNREMQLDTKPTSTSLHMPEPEDAVAHGDANLAVNDFFTITPL